MPMGLSVMKSLDKPGTDIGLTYWQPWAVGFPNAMATFTWPWRTQEDCTEYKR